MFKKCVRNEKRFHIKQPVTGSREPADYDNMTGFHITTKQLIGIFLAYKLPISQT